MVPEDFLKSYEKALASQWWSEVEPLLAEDACIIFSEGTYVGKAEVQKAFEKAFTLIQDERYEIANLYWVDKASDYAVCIYTFRWSGVVNGEQAVGAGRGTSVLKRIDGCWKLLVEHLGPMPSE